MICTGPEVDSALQEGQQIIDEMKKLNFTDREIAIDKESNKTEQLLKNVTEFTYPVENLDKQVDGIKLDFKDFNDKLDDLYEQTQSSFNNALEAEKIIDRSG